MDGKEVGDFIWGTNKSRVITIISTIVIVLLLILIYMTFFYGKICGDYACFQQRMSACQKTQYMNDQPDATWQYNILGVSEGECVTRVTLLQAKEGTLNLNQLNGDTMDCSYPLGIATYPEQDLSKCHGLLKEELQNIIINKLYSYILQNIGQISQNLKTAV